MHLYSEFARTRFNSYIKLALFSLMHQMYCASSLYIYNIVAFLLTSSNYERPHQPGWARRGGKDFYQMTSQSQWHLWKIIQRERLVQRRSAMKQCTVHLLPFWCNEVLDWTGYIGSFLWSLARDEKGESWKPKAAEEGRVVVDTKICRCWWH